MAFHFDDIEHESLLLFIQLEQEDAETLQKGKGRVGDDLNDREMAFGLYHSELEALKGIVSDQVLCTSLSEAIRADSAAIDQHLNIEEEARLDRQQALTGIRPPSSLDTTRSRSEHSDSGGLTSRVTEMMSKLAIDHHLDIDEANANIAGPSSRGGHSQPYVIPSLGPNGKREVDGDRSVRTSAQCIACRVAVQANERIRAPCSHDYCHECLNSLYSAATNDESLFPPRCCGQPIPTFLASPHLASEVLKAFEEKAIEFQTVDRTYCHKTTCSSFIPPDNIVIDVAKCAKCLAKTCVICKGSLHLGDCPDDEATKAVLAMAEANGWKQCGVCRSMVELSTGCNHMTCLCKAQFCYRCGVKWKECHCPQWDENLLTERAEAIVQRDPVARFQHADQFRAAVQEVRNNLEENHECAHRKWTKRMGRHRCEECRYMLPEYIFECRQCRIMACWRCRLNRL